MKETRESTELATINSNRNMLPANSLADLATAGQLLAKSRMFGVDNDAAGFVVVATCYQQGISLMEFHRTYHIVEGRPSMRADAMLAEFRKRGGKCKIVENSQTRAAVEVEFEGQKSSFEFTMEDAKRTGDCFKGDGKTLKATWQRRPEDMLWARLISRMVRRLCPEINAGLYSPEEVQEFDVPARGVAPQAISEDEAARRAKNVTAEATAEPVAAVEIPDATICPEGFGEYSGVPWEKMDDATLEMAAKAEGLSVGHKAVIRRVMQEREDGGK